MKDVAGFIADLPGKEKLIASRLRTIILESDPRLQEKLSYGAPYFFHHRRICFLRPISHLPSRYSLRPENQSKVTLGLCYGNLLSNEQGILLKEGRKQVYMIRYSSINEIDETAVREIILEAVLIDEAFKKEEKNYLSHG